MESTERPCRLPGMTRAIVRYSATTGGAGNELRDAIRDALEETGFVKRGTALWDVSSASIADITKQSRESRDRSGNPHPIRLTTSGSM
jgi:hypothetical protein